MRHGYTIAIAAAFIAGFAQTPAAIAACDPADPGACSQDTQQKAAAPLQLKRFIEVGSARRAGSKSGRHHVTHKRARKASAKAAPKAAPETAPKVADAAAEAPTDSVTPKVIPTVSISVPALALASVTGDRTVGFAASTEPWSGDNAFADGDADTLPPGITVARYDEVNAIDLAADTAAKNAEANDANRAARSVSLVTPANAATAQQRAATPQETSWLSWAYEKIVDSVLAAALAVRSIFA
jgi:hypothetical protein